MFVSIKRKNTHSQDQAAQQFQLDEGEPIVSFVEGPVTFTLQVIFHHQDVNANPLRDATVRITQKGNTKQNAGQTEMCEAVVNVLDRNDPNFYGTVLKVGSRTFLAKCFRLDEVEDW